MTKSNSIAISGASGFIGGHLLDRLAREENATLIAIGRSNTQEVCSKGLEWRKVQNYDGAEFTSALAGCGTLIHLADGSTRHHKIESNYSGLVAAIAESSISRVILASSIYARINENGVVNDYGNRKLLLENALRTISGTSVTAVRLPPVYGVGCKGGFASLAALIKKNLPLPIGRASELRDYISVENVTDLFTACLQAKQLDPFTIVEPSDGQPISTADLALLIGNVIGRPASIFGVPDIVLRYLGRVTGKNEQIEAILSPLRVSQSVDEVATLAGGWRPKQQMPETLEFLKT